MSNNLLQRRLIYNTKKRIFKCVSFLHFNIKSGPTSMKFNLNKSCGCFLVQNEYVTRYEKSFECHWIGFTVLNGPGWIPHNCIKIASQSEKEKNSISIKWPNKFLSFQYDTKIIQKLSQRPKTVYRSRL